jgi:signal transduction histidine kinase
MALTGLRAALIGATPRVVKRLPPGLDSHDPTGSYRLGMEVVRWRGIGRDLMADVLPAVAVGAATVLGSGPAARGEVPPRRPLDLLAWVLMGLAAAVLLGRRRWPLGVLAVTVATSIVYLVLEYPHGPILLTMSVAMYSVANRLPVGGSLAACGVALVAVVLPELLVIDRERLLTEMPLLLAVLSGLLLPSWAIGTVVRLTQETEQRVRQEETRRRADEERLRIAREVHDVVGHGLAVINLQAGVALHVVGRRPEQAEVALAAIKRSSKDALEELRRTLAVFRRPDHQDGPRRPAPGLGQLEALAAAMAEGGLPVQVVVTGERAKLPATVDLAAYRIVQESLSNVARHAGPATAVVRVGYQADAVVLEIADTGRGRAAGVARPGGHGIAGMRERAAAVGGTLQAGPTAEGGFLVRARLPSGRSPG